MASKAFHLLGIIGLTSEIAFGSDPGPRNFTTREFSADDQGCQRYVLLGGPGEGQAAPQQSYGLIVALAGGDGGYGELPFLQRIYGSEIPEHYLLALPIAPNWSPGETQSWRHCRSAASLVSAVLADIGKRLPINPDRVFLFAWSSAGPTAYATGLEMPAIKGALIAMSPFDASSLPGASAEGKTFLIIHSSADLVYPVSMAEEARDKLHQLGATAQLVNYDGGHGWRGSMYALIQEGIAWLEDPSRPAPALTGAPPATTRPFVAGVPGATTQPGVTYDELIEFNRTLPGRRLGAPALVQPRPTTPPGEIGQEPQLPAGFRPLPGQPLPPTPPPPPPAPERPRGPLLPRGTKLRAQQH